MPTIKKNNREFYFDRIVAYGCSYTSGHELGDYLAFPEKTEEEIDNEKRRLGMSKWYDLRIKRQNYDEQLVKKIKEEESKYCWVGQIADALHVPCVNNAIPGAGMEYIFYSLQRDLSEKVIRDTDLIFVGCTSVDRWFWIDKDLNPVKLMIGYHENQWPSTDLYNSFTKESHYFYLLYNYARSVNHLSLISKSIGDRILMFNCHSDLELKFYFFGKENNENLIKFKTMISDLCLMNDCFLDEKFHFSKIENWGYMHGGYHPKKKHHKIYARHFYDLLKPLIV